jgi:hypothetical protein
MHVQFVIVALYRRAARKNMLILGDSDPDAQTLLNWWQDERSQ